ncbi:MAG TPA: hypothetical protein VIS27_11020 [Yeosuana sp.]
MNGFDIVAVFVVIHFARLEVMLVAKYITMKKENKNYDDKTL